jgi:hypothetical protein
MNERGDKKETQDTHANSAFTDSTTKLEHCIRDGRNALRFENIRRDVAGPGGTDIDHARRTANSVGAGCRIVAGLTAVAESDDDGRCLR